MQGRNVRHESQFNSASCELPVGLLPVASQLLNCDPLTFRLPARTRPPPPKGQEATLTAFKLSSFRDLRRFALLATGAANWPGWPSNQEGQVSKRPKAAPWPAASCWWLV